MSRDDGAGSTPPPAGAADGPLDPGAADGPLDPGLQSERTGLAWARTSLATAANAALVARSGIIDHVPALTVAGVGLALVAAAVGLIGWGRHRQIVTDLLGGRHPAESRVLRVPALGAVAAAVIVFVAVLP